MPPRITRLLAASAIGCLAACDDTRIISTPTPVPAPTKAGTGGPCGDGTVLQADEKCR